MQKAAHLTAKSAKGTKQNSEVLAQSVSHAWRCAGHTINGDVGGEAFYQDD